jgi:hypothetical protein
VDAEAMRRRLDRLRREYEPNAIALSHALALPLPLWAPTEPPRRAPRPRALAMPRRPTARTPGR